MCAVLSLPLSFSSLSLAISICFHALRTSALNSPVTPVQSLQACDSDGSSASAEKNCTGKLCVCVCVCVKPKARLECNCLSAIVQFLFRTRAIVLSMEPLASPFLLWASKIGLRPQQPSGMSLGHLP